MTLPDKSFLLKLAHMYGLRSLQEKVAQGAVEDLNEDSAVAVFMSVETMGFHEVQQQCESYILENYESCMHKGSLMQISASQLGRLLRNPALKVSREEVVLQ